MATQQVLIPERRSFMEKSMGQFGQFMQGAQGISSIKGLFGGGGGATTFGGGATGGGMGLGVGNVTPVTTGMSPVLGGGAPAGGGVAPSTSPSLMGGTIMGPAAAVAGGYYANYQIGKAMDEKRDKANDAAKERIRNDPMMRGTTFTDEYIPSGSVDMGPNPNGLSLTGGKPDKLDAMDRRYTNQQTAMQDIQTAQKELVNSGIPEAERKRIGQKLEIARQQMEGRSRGPRSTYT